LPDEYQTNFDGPNDGSRRGALGHYLKHLERIVTIEDAREPQE
jgi:hypothetical protein